MKILRLLCSLALVTSAFAAGRHTKGETPLNISQGAEVSLADFLVPGKTTIFDFTSAYCPPCRAYDDPLRQLHRQKENVTVVKVDINRPGHSRIDWDSPVIGQYAIRSLPHFKVFGPDGKLIAEDTTDARAGRALVNKLIASLE